MESEGLAYVGEEAFGHVRPMEWIQDPQLQRSYMTTAALHQAGRSATDVSQPGVMNELAVGEFDRLAKWLTGDADTDLCQSGQPRAVIDVVRITCETKRLRRMILVEFTVIRSTKKRVIFGTNVLTRLEAMDDDMPDPRVSSKKNCVNRFTLRCICTKKTLTFPSIIVYKQKSKYYHLSNNTHRSSPLFCILRAGTASDPVVSFFYSICNC